MKGKNMENRIYDQDVLVREFDATVVQSWERNGRYYATLDKTAFFPEGGGQGADHGTLNDVQVLDAHEKEGWIVHELSAPLEEGQKVHGVLDWERRFDHMQQHSGEHIFSGLVHSTFGYDNVGFHLGADVVTMDFSGPLSQEQIDDIEYRANEAVWKNLPIETLLPDAETLKKMEYRSKKELSGQVRLVHIPGIDMCACCGTHVKQTGAIGQIKVIAWQHYKQGVRITILCGKRALAYTNRQLQELHRAGVLLSAKQDRVAQTVEKLMHDRDQANYDRDQLAWKLFLKETERLPAEPARIMVCEGLSREQLAKAALFLAGENATGLSVQKAEDQWEFALADLKRDIRTLTGGLRTAFGGKGGGKAELSQGKFERFDPEEAKKILSE